MSVLRESVFQNDIIRKMQSQGWVLGSSVHYNRERALYEEDLLDFVKTTQAQEWEKFAQNNPTDTERHFLDLVVGQLNKADEHATDRQSRTYGTLGVLRHGVRSRNARFFLCQFQPEHNLNPEVLAHYASNRLRLVPELVYSPHSTSNALTEVAAKRGRIDLVLFVNGLPVATMELKSEFMQSVEQAVVQYKKTRQPKDPATKKPEPLLMFKRGAIVHFAVSQNDVYMTTHLNGDSTFFLPFNKGTKDGGAGNDVPEDMTRYATDYLWSEVLQPDSLLNILGRYVHLQIEHKEDYNGRKYKKEIMIFPRYHQWDVVTKLLAAARVEGRGQKYLIQHSAGSGKSNSIAWLAHQLSTVRDDSGNKTFDSVIVLTDRTVLDAQLQDTIYQFEHAEGVVGRINNKEGDGSKSEKLAEALAKAQPIIIVTIQTFPFVLQAIEDSVSLKERGYAIIADEAHSSQTGTTAAQLRRVLMVEGTEGELDQEDLINASLAARRGSANLSYYAFTATPKPKTIELFGRPANPYLPVSDDNKPEAYHVYSMRQAIEEGFILDVLKNYINYKVVYKLRQKIENDQVVDERKAKIKVVKWVRLHEHNISQKVQVIIEHFKKNVQYLLNGQAKAMVVTSSRKEAVRYKLAFDQYIAEQAAQSIGYDNITAMVAFSGEVEFNTEDADSSHLIGHKYTEMNANPGLKGREMRRAFDSDDYQVMIAANKFQTGFDQPKLCAMYVDKKLAGVECVQTLSRLNRIYPGKAEVGTYVLDFFNEPEEVLEAFQPYYKTAELESVSDPDKIFDLFNKLKASSVIRWAEVEQFAQVFYQVNVESAILSNICKLASKRWTALYESAVDVYKRCLVLLERAKKTGDAVLIANAENDIREVKIEKDDIELFKKDLGTYVRRYTFLSQIADYDDKDLEIFSEYARLLRTLLREEVLEEDEMDLSNVEMSHYRLSKVREQTLKLEEEKSVFLVNSDEGGTARPKDRKETFLSTVIARLNDLFVGEGLTDGDLINYAFTISGKVRENDVVMTQIHNNTPEQAFLGDFPKAVEDAIFSSNDASQKLMMKLMSSSQKMEEFKRIVFEMVLAEKR